MRSSIALALALVLAAPASLRAQEEPPPPLDKEADYRHYFEQGFELLKAKRYDDSIKRFQACIALYPDRAVSYYNIACAYSLKKEKEKALDWLEKSMDKGFLDLAHMSRDTDLDAVREEEGYRALVSKARKKILKERPAAVKIVPKDAPAKAPLVVFLHGDSTNVEELAKKLGPLADRLGAYLLVPSGRTVNAAGAHWDTTAEVCVVHDVEAALEEFDVDPERVVLAGELGGATHALAFAARHGWKRVVAASGYYEKVEGDAAKDMRVFLFAPRSSEGALEAARTARDDLLASGAKVRVERHEGQRALPDDVGAALERAIAWTLRRTPAGRGEIKKY